MTITQKACAVFISAAVSFAVFTTVSQWLAGAIT